MTLWYSSITQAEHDFKNVIFFSSQKQERIRGEMSKQISVYSTALAGAGENGNLFQVLNS
jgi:hypothetical protein